MYLLISILTVSALLFSTYFILLALRPTGPVDKILFFFNLFTAQIILIGYILSWLNYLSEIGGWAVLSLMAALIGFLILRLIKIQIPNVSPGKLILSIKHAISSINDWFQNDLSSLEKVIIGILALTTLLLGILNLMVAIFTVPNNWDSLAYHLPRMAYYLQHNNFNYFDANYYAQVAHPKNSALLLIFTYLTTLKNENLLQLLQYFSYWVAVCSVYGISRKIGNDKTKSIFAALVSSLLIEWLLQATTTQTDMIITAFYGASIYFMFAFRQNKLLRYIFMSALGIGLSIGISAKAMLVLPSVGLIALYLIFQQSKSLQKRLRYIGIWSVSIFLAFCIFALPAGYLDNYRNFGNPIGPEVMRSDMSFEGVSAGSVVKNGTMNLLRYGFDFLSFDGLPSISIVRTAQDLLRSLPQKIVTSLGIHLEEVSGTRSPFSFKKVPIAHEDFSYWGVLGFGLIWPIIFLSLLGIIRRTDFRILSIAVILYLLLQSFTGPYDPWRGRYFSVAAIFAAPMSGFSLKSQRRLLNNVYLFLVIMTGCISALLGIVLRSDKSLISFEVHGIRTVSIFTMPRMRQMTINNSNLYDPLVTFNKIVPEDASVAVFLDGNTTFYPFEYPLFGKQLTRTILPINSFKNGLMPIPENAEYLLYEQGYPCANIQEDVSLGYDWYLRKLNAVNRYCNP